MRRSATIILAALACLAVLLPAAAGAMPRPDITIEVGDAVHGARLHTAAQGYGPTAYDVMADGEGGQITFYKRAVSGPAGQPRGAVLESWTYDLWAVPRSFSGAAMADSAAITGWGNATKVSITPRDE